MDNKNKPFVEIDAYAIHMINSEKNYYKGCAKCRKKWKTIFVCVVLQKKVNYI